MQLAPLLLVVLCATLAYGGCLTAEQAREHAWAVKQHRDQEERSKVAHEINLAILLAHVEQKVYASIDRDPDAHRVSVLLPMPSPGTDETLVAWRRHPSGPALLHRELVMKAGYVLECGDADKPNDTEWVECETIVVRF